MLFAHIELQHELPAVKILNIWKINYVNEYDAKYLNESENHLSYQDYQLSIWSISQLGRDIFFCLYILFPYLHWAEQFNLSCYILLTNFYPNARIQTLTSTTQPSFSINNIPSFPLLLIVKVSPKVLISTFTP